MSIIVEPDFDFPTHDISLSDGKNSVGLILCDSAGNHNPHAITRAPVPRTALKTTSGNQKYSDFEPPWSPVAQEDWSGGRGLEDFDLDVSRYYDGWRANTLYGQIFLGGQETYGTGYRDANSSLPGSVSWLSILPGTNKYAAVKFTTLAAYSATTIYLWLKRKGTPPQDLNVVLCSDDAGNPGAALQSAAIDTDDITDIISEFYKISFTGKLLGPSTDYWIKVYAADADDDNCWMIATKASAGTTKRSPDGAAWYNAAYDLYYRITGDDGGRRYKFFRYKYALYAIRKKAFGSPTLYINGDRGVADANTGALGTLVDATKSWTVNEWAGCVVRIIGGKGVEEAQPWRVVSSNTATALTVSEDWLIEHDTTTEYVILASNKWTEITGHGLTADVKSILVINDIVYLAQGDSVNMRRARWYNNGGTATYEYADDGTNKATFLKDARDYTDGNLRIWRANNDTISVSKAPVAAWGTNLVFGTAIPFMDSWGKITGLDSHGENADLLWVFREGSVFVINTSDKAEEIPLKEMHASMEYTNGSVSLPHNVYLYFNFGDGLERYYNNLLDDVGPNKDEGLPNTRQGVISCMVGYPGKILAGIDAGSNGISSVLVNSGTSDGSGWSEIYRAPAAGLRVWDMAFDPIPGNTIDRLWIAVGDDFLWIPFPSGVKKPTRESNYTYVHESVVQSGYIYVGLYDIHKFFHSLKLFTEGLSKDTCWVEVDYRIDDDTAWTTIDGEFDESPMKELNLVPSYGVNGKRIQLRLRLQTSDNTKTPIIKGTVLDNVSRVPVKYAYSFAFRNYDNDVNLLGEPEDYTADTKQTLLNQWAMELTPLLMRSTYKQYDNQTVFIDPAELQTVKEKAEGYIGRLSVIQI